MIFLAILLVLAVLLAFGVLKPYRMPNTYFAQIEGCALVNVRIGYTAWGLYWAYLLKHRHGRNAAWRLLPRFDVTVWAHTGQSNQRWLFRVRSNLGTIGYRTRGEATPQMHDYANAGFKFRLR